MRLTNPLCRSAPEVKNQGLASREHENEADRKFEHMKQLYELELENL